MGVRAGNEVSPEMARSLTEYVQSEVSESGVYDVISQADIAAAVGIERQKQLLGCSESCMADLAGALNADRLLQGEVAVIDKVALLNISLLDAQGVRVIARVSRKRPQVAQLLDDMRATVYELLNGAPELQGRPLELERGFGGVVVGVRGEADVFGPALVGAVTAELSGRYLGAALSVIPKATPGFRLEARAYPIELSRVRPFLCAGVTAFITSIGVRGGVGAAVRIGHVQIFFDVAYERYVASFRPPDEVYNTNALLLSLGAGWAF
jgi:hypothetical protein